MTQIVTFARNSDGSYTGTIKALAFNVQARLTPSDPATASEKSPDLRVVVSGVEIGAAWLSRLQPVTNQSAALVL